MTTVSLGVCSFNRPEFLERCGKALVRNLYVDGNPVIDNLYVYNDGSDSLHNGAYKRAYKSFLSVDAVVIDNPVNRGVAHAKNELLGMALDDGADQLFILEDDLLLQSPKAITEYLRVAESQGHSHFSFAHHGSANSGGPVDVDGEIEFYPHSVGAFCLYSRELLEKVGLFDTQMVNAMEHCEHEMRSYSMGFAPNGGPHRFADIVGSADYIKEIPGSIEKSSIRPRGDWQQNIRNSLRYWSSEKPDTFAMLFGPDMPLHAYAMSLIG